MEYITSHAFAFVIGCGCGYFLKFWFDNQIKKFENKND